ncbi:hypothetical protein THAR02_10542 [Trichoderma harzianum]|uniref:UvrD-like helicase ATP-binding domain-containing protein n=1 Tax=Trichoderma harzianum TaxID=5544 RepID=A0A0F9WW15_TRIHA|nr:hypothetical protein THAR02_10542 [Trichoderma harzianum]
MIVRLPHIVKLRVFCPKRSPRFSTHSPDLLQRWEEKSLKPSFTPSIEQLRVVRLCRMQNVVVSARPGSGKTATAEAIIAAHPDKRVAVITYSKRLQLETRHRLHNYTNCEVFTFHGMAGSLFGAVVRNDAELLEQRRKILRCNALPRWNYTPFDIIVLDEFQDCTEIIYWLTNCFILANKLETGSHSPQLVVLGDERQSIYRFRGADHRYLSLAPQILAHTSPYPFVKIPLSQSFRLSDHLVQFVNRVFLNDESYISSSKPGPKPIVLRCDPYDSYALAKRLSALIKRYGAKDSALIAPSLRKNKPLKLLTNILSKKYRIPIAISTNDEVALDDRVTYGKMCVSTIHQFKGSERHLVILFGIDSSFFENFGRDISNDRCPNEIFVALTRAGKQLVLVHDESKKLMPFMSVEDLYETAEVVNMTNNLAKLSVPNPTGQPLQLGLALPASIPVRDMVRHIQDEPLQGIITRELCIQKLSPPLPKQEHINIPNVVLSDPRKRFYEAVSDINGLVTVAAFEHSTTGTLNTLKIDQSLIEVIPPIGSTQYISWLCRYACEYEAGISGYLPRKNQMENHAFDWMMPRDLALARNRIQGELGDGTANIRFEVYAEQTFSVDDNETRLQGQADIVAVAPPSDNSGSRSADSIWEIKFVSHLSNSHVIQACTYAYLLGLTRIMLYNVRDGEKWEIIPHDGQEGLRRMIESVLRVKYTTTGQMNDKEFIDMCAKVMLEVSSLDDSREQISLAGCNA